MFAESDTEEEGNLLREAFEQLEEEERKPVIDSLLLAHQPGVPSYTLRLFKEEDVLQKIVSASLVAQGKVNIIFRIPSDSVVIRDYINMLEGNWFIPEFTRNRDTLSLWLPEIPADTLFLEISDRGNIIDSVRVSMVRRAAPDRTRGRATQARNVLAVSTPTVTSRVHPFFRPFEVHSGTPLASINPEKFRLFLNDSIPVDAAFSFTDSVQRILRMDYSPKPDSSYVLRIDEGAMRDIFDAENDSLRVPFKVNNATSYGTIIISLTLPPDDSGEEKQYILQLMSDNLQNVISEKIVRRSGNYRFDYLPASSFTFRLIEDSNRNGRWDPGKYVLGLQPEEVFILKEKVQARLNWEVETEWEAGKR
jgi:hypothetical protein